MDTTVFIYGKRKDQLWSWTDVLSYPQPSWNTFLCSLIGTGGKREKNLGEPSNDIVPA